MLVRFTAETLGRYDGANETDALPSRAIGQLKASHPVLTKRKLDHTIWSFQRSQ